MDLDPEAITAWQWKDLICGPGKNERAPEWALMVTLLVDCFDTIRDLAEVQVEPYSRKGRQLRDALQWVCYPDVGRDDGVIVSFRHCCDALGLDVDAMRDRLLGVFRRLYKRRADWDHPYFEDHRRYHGVAWNDGYMDALRTDADFYAVDRAVNG